ncbi:MAG: hypothetical protein AVDCRST_MAG36-1278, partial [uncultured Nocardioidaceae bacterium]
APSCRATCPSVPWCFPAPATAWTSLAEGRPPGPSGRESPPPRERVGEVVGVEVDQSCHDLCCQPPTTVVVAGGARRHL